MDSENPIFQLSGVDDGEYQVVYRSRATHTQAADAFSLHEKKLPPLGSGAHGAL